jgi:hypothetical protein
LSQPYAIARPLFRSFDEGGLAEYKRNGFQGFDSGVEF